MGKKVELSDSALQVAKSRYFMEGENWETCTNRVAKTVSEPESKKNEYREKFHEIIYNMEFIPGGRIMRNSGRTKGSLFNCYVLPIGDSIEEIGQFKKEALILWSMGGGVGCNWSSLRPKNDPIFGKGGKSSGLVSFLESADFDARQIESGGSRRAAALACLEVSHPEIMDFIDAKIKHGTLQHHNISVGVTNEFLEAVELNKDWEFKFKQRSYGSVPARDIWNKIVENMLNHAEPGLLNFSNLFKNNSYYYDPVVSTNPCHTGDSKVYVYNEGNVSFKELVERGEDVPVVSRNFSTNALEVKMMRRPRKTAENVKILKIGLDNKMFFRCSEDHEVSLYNGITKKAKDLKVGDKLYKLIKCSDGKFTNLVNGFRAFNRHGSKDEFKYKYIEAYLGFYKPKVDLLFEDGVKKIKRKCTICKKTFIIDFDKREQFLCSDKCYETFLYSRNRCSDKRPSSQNFIVTEVIEDGFEDVYNGTVEDNSNYFVSVGVSDNNENVENYFINSKNCGEAVLSPHDICCLGSIVLPNFITNVNTNWVKLENVIKLAVRFLDNVIEVNKYVLKENDIKAHNSRRIGLGVLGLAEYLFSKGLRYGSEKALVEVDKLCRFIKEATYRASIELAVEKGAFPKFESVPYIKASFIRKLPIPIRMEIKEKGIRNVTCLSYAPTGCLDLYRTKIRCNKDSKDEILTIKNIFEINGIDIENEKNNNNKWFESKKEILVKTIVGLKPITKLYINGYSKVKTIKTKTSSISGTYDHKVLVKDNGTPKSAKWVELKDLKIGDKIIIVTDPAVNDGASNYLRPNSGL